MACDGHFGLAMAAPGLDPVVKPADVTVPTTLGIEQRAISRLDKGPLEIHIDIAPDRAKADLPAAGVLPRHQSAVARQLLGTAKPLDTSDLSPNHRCQGIAHPRKTLKPVGLSAGRKELGHLSFNLLEIGGDVIEFIEDESQRLLGVGRKLNQKLLHNLAALLPKASLAPSTV